MKKDQCLSVFEYKIFPSLRKIFFRQTYLHLLYIPKTGKCKYVWRKKFFLRLGKILWHFNIVYCKFFLNKLLSGKRFEQFCCHQKTPEKSRKSVFVSKGGMSLFLFWFLKYQCTKFDLHWQKQMEEQIILKTKIAISMQVYL